MALANTWGEAGVWDGQSSVNQPPTANAGSNQSVASYGSVKLGGTVTGTKPLTIEWEVTDGEPVVIAFPNSLNPVVTAAARTYAYTSTITLTVTDEQGQEATDSMTLSVEAPKQPKLTSGKGTF